jgi:hypothetical protein
LENKDARARYEILKGPRPREHLARRRQASGRPGPALLTRRQMPA